MLRSFVSLALVLAVAAGCGGDDDAASTSPSEKPSPSITVSADSTCHQLFSGDAPFNTIIDWWREKKGVTLLDVADAMEELREIAATAGDSLGPYLVTVADETQKAIDDGNDSTVFKAAGFEVAGICSAEGY